MEMDAETIASRAEATYNVDFRMYVNTIYEYPAWTVAAGVRCTLEEQRRSLYHDGWILGKKEAQVDEEIMAEIYRRIEKMEKKELQDFVNLWIGCDKAC